MNITGLHHVTAITESFGYRLTQEAGNRVRFAAPGKDGAGKMIELVCTPGSQSGRLGAGSVHHIAFRVPDDALQQAWREKIVGLGYSVSPVMDRIYFRSIYFRETGGILFEIATDPPGFTNDETVDELGARLRLPPWLERVRPQIEEALPRIALLTEAPI
jgi:glyoxalase family protein